MRGLKENVIIGHLIPAGTGLRQFDTMKVWVEDGVEEEIPDEAVQEPMTK